MKSSGIIKEAQHIISGLLKKFSLTEFSYSYWLAFSEDISVKVI